MNLNVTYTEEEQDKMRDPVPWEIKNMKLSEMISEECFNRIFKLEVTNLEFITIMGCISDNV